MRPFTETASKLLIPVLGRPFAELQLERLAAQGIKRVVYSVGYRADMVQQALGSGERFGLQIDYVDEGPSLRGTAGAVRLAIDRGALPSAFFVLNGDSYLSIDLLDMQRLWEASALPALMAVFHNAGRWDQSNAEVSDDGRVLYDKRSSAAGCEWIDYGMSIIAAQVVTAAVPAGGSGDLADVMRALSLQGAVGAYRVSERFYEVGSPVGLRDLEAHLLSRVERGT